MPTDASTLGSVPTVATLARFGRMPSRLASRLSAIVGVALTASVLTTAPSVSAAGNPDGRAHVPAEARAVDTSRPDRYIGNGTRANCTSRRVVQTVAKGGVIRSRCDKKPFTIKMNATAKVFNDRPDVVLDGRGKVTLGIGVAIGVSLGQRDRTSS